MVSPYDEQAANWNEDKMRHERLFASADVLTATGHEYTRGCLFRRNRYLVDTADLLLAAYNGQPGGTAMTVSPMLTNREFLSGLLPSDDYWHSNALHEKRSLFLACCFCNLNYTR